MFTHRPAGVTDAQVEAYLRPMVEKAAFALSTNEAWALLAGVALLGLLLVSAIEGKRAAGMPLEEALVAGSVEKLRAVLMAALLALFGLLPMAISTGVGSETQRPFALVIVGGMVTTLVITLLLLPAVYYMTASERYVTPEELDEAAEVFLCGTAAEIVPVGSIDTRRYQVGPMTRGLMEDYARLVRQPRASF